MRRLMTLEAMPVPSSMSGSAHGDLILDPQLRGQLCHSGVTLTSSNMGDAFLFAYNFAHASTYRVRHGPKTWRAAARQVQQI